VYSQDFGGNKQQHDETVMHELSHASDYGGYFMPNSDKRKIDLYAYDAPKGNPLRGKLNKLDSHGEYIADPTETRARLMNFRYNSLNQNLYNPFEEEITLDKLKKYKETSGGYDPLMQLREVYSDKEIIDMLNTISKTENNTDAQAMMAAYGGLIKAQYGGDPSIPNLQSPVSRYKKGGWLNAYK
jgi:hypothetical protein